MRQLLVFLLISLFAFSLSCRRNNSEFVTVALPEKFTTFDTLTTVASDSAAERVRSIIFNTLVRKDEHFNYVGELAKDIKISDDGKTVTFTLRDGVKFHNGKDFTSADVKYTFDELFKANGYKAGAFFDTVPVAKGNAPATAPTTLPPVPVNANASTAPTPKPEASPLTQRIAHITSIETPDPKTVIFTVTRPALANQLLSNLVAVPIVCQGTIDQLKDQPIGTGSYKFVGFDASQNIVELAANPDYWEGAPKVAKLRLKTVTDANSLQAELQTGGVDIAPNPSNLPPDSIKSLGSMTNLKVEQTDGSNIQYLVFNTSPNVLNNPNPLSNAKIRQAIGYAVDRNKIVSELLFDQAKTADSILPPQSWAYTPGTQYTYDPNKAKQLLQEAGYKNEPIVFKYSSGNSYVNQYSQVIQSSLADVGLNIQIETLEVNTIRTQLAQGQYQMYTGIWIGGNQDPIFLRDLFASSKIPGVSGATCCNRSRYSNPQVDSLVQQAIDVTATDRDQAKQLYSQVWETVSNDLPLLPLWYPANIVIANKRVGNIKINPSGDYSFVKDIVLQ
ncbi:MAG TPA: ABC transporter substrate-binding protein [Pyrinomonadaceae bacterium]|nr:ABC transporter substrate-binding protein [Pyrinomonadaceae bacterium]